MPESILAIHNGKSSRAFSLTPQDLLEDKSLSSDAKVVISWMIGKPKGWVFRIGHLRESLGIHSDSVWRRVRKELTEKGFLSISRYVKNGEIAWDVRVNLVDYDMRREDVNKAKRVVPAVSAPAPAPAPADAVVAVEVETASEIVEALAVPAVSASERAIAPTVEVETVSEIVEATAVEIESEIPAPATARKRRWTPELPTEIAEAIKPSQQFLAAKLFESLCEQRPDGSIGEKLDERGRAYAAQIVGEADSPIALLKHLSKVGVRVGRLPELARPGETIVQAKARLAHREPKQSTYRPSASESAAKKIDLAAFLESDSNGHDAAPAPAPAPAAPAPDGAALIKSCPDEYMRWLKSASFATLKMIEDVGGVLAALEKFGPKTLLADEFAQARVALAQTPPQRSAPSSKSGFKGFRDFAASLKRA